MAKLTGNRQLVSSDGASLGSLRDINRLALNEKERVYADLLPDRLLGMLAVCRETLLDTRGRRLIEVKAPEGLGLLRLEVRADPEDHDTVFFLELADTPYHQLELSFCIISDPTAPRYYVDRDADGRDNWFATMGRNIDEELRAMVAGLFPNQTRRGLRMFGEFFVRLERFADSLGVEMISAEPLTYDNAIRYEKYGFEYLTGLKLMTSIHEGFAPGGELFRRLDGSTPFRMPGMEKSVRGRSWALHDGIMDEPWDGVRIYHMIGTDAGLNTFPDRETEDVTTGSWKN